MLLVAPANKVDGTVFVHKFCILLYGSDDVVVDTIKHVSFSAPAFIASTGASEPLVSALATKTAKGAFAGPVKGNNGVYMLQVINKTKTAEKFDAKNEEASIGMNNFRNVSSTIINSLYLKANVKDNRYKFF